MTLSKDPLNLIITGVGGQGNVLASQWIGRALVRENFYVTIGETYGASHTNLTSNIEY
jgi:indolepyruvate ferredoxin oxidoreductase beta subunit